ncbi:HAUS1 protein, partial [Alectura lathami]|nr:HAUS1 protein [Alectura lathami]
QVTSWLKKIFEKEPIPQYEVNAQTVDILYDLAECIEERDRDASLLIEDMEQMAAEYEADAHYLESLLTESLGLLPSSLSKEGAAHLETLVDSAMILETKDTSITSFFCAINDMTFELYDTELENREMERELTIIKKKLTASLALEKKLEEDLEKAEKHLEVQQAKDESRSQKLAFLKEKSEDLKIRIKAAEDQLSARGLDQSLTHQSLVSMSE